MAWIVGIDEAGYGPNLGPFVMSAVVCQVPQEHASADLWSHLQEAIRRPGAADDDRFVVGDSKQIYSPGKGLRDLETSVLAFLSASHTDCPCALARLLERVCLQHELAGEPWYAGSTPLPLAIDAGEIDQGCSQFRATCSTQETSWPLSRSVVICPAQFNALVDRHGSKGGVLAHALGELVQAVLALHDGREPLNVFVDKHGGRNNYVVMLQDMLPDRMVMAREERMSRSVYEALGGEHVLRFTFQPRADDEHCCVALASMISKYVRETLMHEFNRFWQTHLPELKPTAGYPGDAERYYREIRPVMKRLGLEKSTIWRNR